MDTVLVWQYVNLAELTKLSEGKGREIWKKHDILAAAIYLEKGQQNMSWQCPGFIIKLRKEFKKRNETGDFSVTFFSCRFICWISIFKEIYITYHIVNILHTVFLLESNGIGSVIYFFCTGGNGVLESLCNLLKLSEKTYSGIVMQKSILHWLILQTVRVNLLLMSLAEWDTKPYTFHIPVLTMLFCPFFSIIYVLSFLGLLFFPSVLTKGIPVLCLETQALLIMKKRRQCHIRRKCFFPLSLHMQRKTGTILAYINFG